MSQPAPHRILLAEADEAIASSLAKVLATAGYEVRTVTEGAAAARQLACGGFALLLVDLDTFSDESMVFCENLREADDLCPILLLSASATRALREDAKLVGELLDKPTDGGVLLDRISHLLATSRLHSSGLSAAAVLGRQLSPKSQGCDASRVWRRPRFSKKASPDPADVISRPHLSHEND